MPKVGMEPIRREALIKATIAEIGEAGSLDFPVARIARRAGVSSALAHHYLGSKEQMFLTAMRYTLAQYRADVVRALAAAAGPEARLRGIVEQSFSARHFQRGTISAWMNFYLLAHSNPTARRLLTLYRRRLMSNLLCELRPLLGVRAPGVARRMAFLIDGAYLNEGLGEGPPDGAAAAAQVLDYLDLELRGAAR
ncbi:transcriptional regulator BetI [Rhodovulum euryhalinum]|uniref:HTH-type transcriptional regulator BetI n=1 Tax=Rhodovulum euryhalinum TaxID=35805 RepID=A0A4R2KN12_9RHOB|nr:transcriptional regulator BetI [Rhodovulum euryhalinum]TCO74062.1 TetR family transcriptional regulator [Rhodovulum euryhalinum]